MTSFCFFQRGVLSLETRLRWAIWKAKPNAVFVAPTNMRNESVRHQAFGVFESDPVFNAQVSRTAIFSRSTRRVVTLKYSPGQYVAIVVHPIPNSSSGSQSFSTIQRCITLTASQYTEAADQFANRRSLRKSAAVSSTKYLLSRELVLVQPSSR